MSENNKNIEENQAKPAPADNGQEMTNDDTAPILAFELPPVTETGGDFEGDDIPAPAGESGESSGPSDAELAEQYRGTLDDRGNAYDPLLHSYPPEKTGKLGKWRKLSKAEREKNHPGQTSDTAPLSNAAYRGEAEKFARVYAQAHMLPFGADGALKKVEDIMPLVDDLERYFMENGHKEMPAGMAVAISAVTYSLSVCSRPTNAEKLKKWFSPLWEKIKNKFSKKKKESPTVENSEPSKPRQPHPVKNDFKDIKIVKGENIVESGEVYPAHDFDPHGE